MTEVWCAAPGKEQTLMEKMVNVYFFGKKYTVPADLTIMTAMEYAGYTLKRGCDAATDSAAPVPRSIGSRGRMS